MKFRLSTSTASFCALLVLVPAMAHAAGIYDLVITGGRVMDPETRFDAVRNVGIRDGRIAVITEADIQGRHSINARGLVVAPGFIDTHIHGQDPFAIKMALRDGVTSGMDLEAGAINVAQWYADKEHRWQMNYGTAVSHLLVRMQVLDSEVDFTGPVDATTGNRYVAVAGADGVSNWVSKISTTRELNQISQRVDEELRQGALGLGSGLAYAATGISSYEMFELQRATSRYQRVTAVHTRYHLDPIPPTEAAIAFDEIFTNAALLKAPLLVVHNNDHGWEEIEEKLQLARSQGLNMWSEHYPYMAVSTVVGALFFKPEIWEDKYGYDYTETLYAPQSDQFLDRRAYEKLVENDPGQVVMAFMPKRSNWLPYWLSMPHMTVASDGMPGVGADGNLLPWTAPWAEYTGHPRAAGSHAKTLRLGRNYGVPLMHALAQLSYWSAKHLGDAGLQAMQQRGRMQVGMVADITIFDPQRVTDNATYKSGEQGLPSTGIPWVIVNGQVVVNDSQVVEHLYPGQPLRYAVVEKPKFVPLDAEKWVKEFTIREEAVQDKLAPSHLR